MIKKSEVIWNIIASVVTSILSAILLMFCTRINGTEIAGMFSIAFATSIILNGIGDYGIRLYQVTDSKRKYKFGEYRALRLFVTFIMLLIGIIFVFVSGYELDKLLICLCLILFRVIDNLSETYQGEFQLQGRMDIAGKSVVIRNVVAMIVFLITDLITKNVIAATFMLFITNAVLFIFYDMKKINKFTNENINFNKIALKTLLIECLPVCISTMLSLYITNAVKYAIDNVGNYKMQTYYNIIYLPTFTINLATSFIIKPMLRVFGEYWNNRKQEKLYKLIIKFIILVTIFTIILEIICMTIAIPILNVIYNVELNEYKIDLLILVLSGAFYSISLLMLYILTTIRKQRQTTIIYIIVSIIAVVIPNLLVAKYGMRGATISNLLVNLNLALLLGLLYTFSIKKQIKNRGN